MPQIHLFNPENDLALASGNAHFTPPASASALAKAGAALPLWYGRDGDKFIGAVNETWYKQITETFDIPQITPTLTYEPGYHAVPWGWSAAARYTFEQYGFPDTSLPDNSTLDKWRILSSRVTSAPVLINVVHAHPELFGEHTRPVLPHIVTTLQQAMEVMADGNRYMIKLPWSGSGRGQQDTAKTTPQELMRRVTGMINRQGAVEITQYYPDAIINFALLFNHHKFVGYSLFNTDTHGGWTGNLLLPDYMIEKRILEATGNRVHLAPLIRTLEQQLADPEVNRGYKGPVGVDFLVDKYGNMPPLEINWRRTMGHVANALQRRLIPPDRQGIFTIRPSQPGNIRPTNLPEIKDGQLVRGTLSLIPPGAGLFDIQVHVPGGKC